MGQPFVTALIPTGNRQHLIPLAISCALSQTYPNFEVLVVDDGIDPTPIPKDPRLRYVRLPDLTPWPEWTPRRLLGAKINDSIPYAKGEIIMHFDDDDWYAPGRMQDQVDLLLSSGKQVVGYHEFLVWHSDWEDPVRFRFPSPPYSAGATQAYFRTWWEGHKFSEGTKTGMDTIFSNDAKKAGQLASKAGKGMFVARQHGDNTWLPSMIGNPVFARADRKELPPEFLAAIR